MDRNVIQGQEKYLFLGETPHNYNEIIQGKLSLSEKSLNIFKNNIKGRSEYCKEKGIAYKHFIFPEKTNVLAHLYPHKIVNNILEQSQDYFTKEVIDLSATLKSIDFPYLKTDTHLSFDGEVASSIKILSNFFMFEHEKIKNIFEGFKDKGIEVFCDLGRKLKPQLKEVRYTKKTGFLQRYHNRAGVNDGLFILCLNKEKLKNGESKRLLIFGDSFMEFNLQFLSYFYSEILFCRTRYFHKEMVEMFKPDDLITENIERYLASINSDDEAPIFNLMYGIRGIESPINAVVYEAYNANLLFGRKPYKEFLNKFLQEIDD